jgi:arylsulfatase A-like enzyme
MSPNNATPRPAQRTRPRSLPGLPALAFLLSFACSLAAPRADAQSDPRPNIIYILADDLGYGDLGCYGQETLETPNIDRLAVEGMRFTQHYAGNTVCAPSRSALLEGKHTGRTGVRGNLPYHLLDTNAATLGKALKAAGYETAVIGKWGVGHPPPLDDPQRHGFDHHFGYINMWHAHNFYPEFLYRNGEKYILPGNVLDPRITFPRQPEGSGVAMEKVVFAPFELEREALEYIDHPRQKPFFLFLSMIQPHNNGEYGRIYGDGGYEVPTYGKYINRPWPRAEKGFAASIRMIDDTVGNVMLRLAEAGLEENTIVIFGSDNGSCHGSGHDHQFFQSSGPLRGYKRDLYEGGIRVPLIVRWPGKVRPGSTSDHLNAMWDLFPTFAEIAGAPVPADLDGISMLPTWLGQPNQKRHDYLYWEYHEQGGKQAVRQGKWKAVHLNLTDPNKETVFELFDLETDLGEQTNVADRFPAVAAQLRSLMTRAHHPHHLLKLFPGEN